MRSTASLKDESVAIIDFGASSSRLYLIEKGVVKKTHSILMSGVEITRSLNMALRISFEEAETTFYDERARVIPDPDHSQNEERFILLGLSFNLNLLVICHTFLEKLGVIRIISARKATKKETNKYI